jgi:D-3-phosphoglycerate dehydrogenase / 2-oxoglutarate reductase
MSLFKVIFLEHGYKSVDPERQIITSAGGEFVDGDQYPLNEAMKKAGDAEGIMLRRIPISRENIRNFVKCRILMRYGVGVDNIDLAAATEAGIIVGHVPVYCQDEVSTHAIALLLACIRRVVATDRLVRAAGWNVHEGDPVLRLAGKTLGIVGLGTLGQAVARKLQGWNLRIIATDPYLEANVAHELDVELVPFEDLLRQSDFVSLHVPLLPETTHLINSTTIGLMKRGAVLVNTARGPVVSGSALLRALDEGHLSCAALDVFEQEPPPAESALLRHPRLIVTDHMAWYSEESQLELQRRAAEEVARCCTGRLPEAIANPEVLKKLGRANEWTPNHLARWQARRAARPEGRSR